MLYQHAPDHRTFKNVTDGAGWGIFVGFHFSDTQLTISVYRVSVAQCHQYSIPACLWNIKAIAMPVDSFVTLHKRLHVALSKITNLYLYPSHLHKTCFWSCLLMRGSIATYRVPEAIRICFSKDVISSSATEMGTTAWLSLWLTPLSSTKICHFMFSETIWMNYIGLQWRTFSPATLSLMDAELTWIYSLGWWGWGWIVTEASTWSFLP